jgi:hypothetical protein
VVAALAERGIEATLGGAQAAQLLPGAFEEVEIFVLEADLPRADGTFLPLRPEECANIRVDAASRIVVESFPVELGVVLPTGGGNARCATRVVCREFSKGKTNLTTLWRCWNVERKVRNPFARSCTCVLAGCGNRDRE